MKEWFDQRLLESFDEESNFVYELVNDICANIGPGSPCSPGERERAASLKKNMEKVVDEVHIEEFQTTYAYLGWFKTGSIIISITILLFFLSISENKASQLAFSILGFIFSLIILLTLVLEFFLSIEFIDFLYTKHNSQNVVGSLLPRENETKDNSSDYLKSKRIIVFSGHHDTSPEFRLLKYLKSGYYVGLVILFVAVIAVFLGFIFRLVYIILDKGMATEAQWNIDSFKYLSYSLFPLAIFLAFIFIESQKKNGSVPGAIDNLQSSVIAIAMARLIKKYPELHPKNTEIRILSCGSEEANMKGSLAYAKTHLKELKEANAMVINFESIVDPEISILTSDNNGFTKNSMELVEMVEKAAKKAEVPYLIEPFPFGGGGTDAFGFSKMGIHATSLFSLKVPRDMIHFYHQSNDTADKINKEAIKNVFKMCVQFLQDFNH